MVRKRKGAKYANGNYKSYQKAYDSTPRQKRKRASLNRENRKRGTYGNRDGKDVSHSKGGKTRLMIRSKNRAANGHGKRSRYA
tara:strand:+ start:1298 stop:1546 length:249 start_codon:yes stop_codon:yes gene_type:complete